MKMTTMMMLRREGADEEEAGAGGVLRASGADAGNTERETMEMIMMKLVRKVMVVVCYAPPARMLMAF